MHSQDAIGVAAEWDWIGVALHDLCQPLTTLECQLFLGGLDTNAEAPALRETIRVALVECTRMRLMMRSTQDRLMLMETPRDTA